MTTGASCAYASVLLGAQDSTTGSANGTVAFDNAQVWNVTTTGQASMPYCELRSPNSPAQLVVSGLLGDLPAPAYVACGTYLASWAAGSLLSLLAGRRGSGLVGRAARQRVVRILWDGVLAAGNRRAGRRELWRLLRAGAGDERGVESKSILAASRLTRWARIISSSDT